MDSASAAQEHHEIVIVGGGICGLATALALHRKGLRSVVLEKSESLRSTGAAIGVLANGWRALDHLGVADHLRQKALLIQGAQDISIDQGTRQHFQFPSGEARCLKRSDLIEALADALPPETIRFGCQIVSLEMDPQNIYPTLHSSDGKSICAKVLLGCDGSKSIVGEFLRLKPTRLSALCAVRGLTYYPNGHTFAQEFVRMSRNRTLFGQIPIDDKLVYWFVTQPSTQFADAKFLNDPEFIKQATLETVSGFPTDVIEMIQGSELDSLSLTHLRYRAPWEILVGRFSKGPIAVAGDAMHVMGPFLGQGGSAGIEDSVVLARNLAQKISSTDLCGREEQNMANKIAEALQQFVGERRMRVVRLSTQTYLTGLILETTSTVVKYISVALIAILFSDRSGHTKYDCGHL